MQLTGLYIESMMLLPAKKKNRCGEVVVFYAYY
jgi:hypothetical protein